MSLPDPLPAWPHKTITELVEYFFFVFKGFLQKLNHTHSNFEDEAQTTPIAYANSIHVH